MERRIAVLGDIHSNLEALEAVVADAKGAGVTEFVCVGDVVGYNANPSECLEIIRSECSAVVRGNHDHYCCNDESLDDFHPLAASVVAWTRRQLSGEQLDFLRNLAYQKMTHGMMLVHSTLDMPERWGYVFDSLDAEAHFSYQTMAICFHGHTHVPMVFEKQGSGVHRAEPHKITVRLGRKYFVNTGSVGQPRDGDPRSAYVIYTPKLREVEFRRVAYDMELTQSKILEAGLPERLAHRLEHGR